MLNKALRILIADKQHFQRLRMERLFNQLGYYRVAPAQNLEELLTLIEYGDVPFDLVVINAALAGEALDLNDYFLDHPQVRHALIYAGAQSPPIPFGGSQKIRLSDAALPDLISIQRLMTTVDPRLPFVGTVISVR
ncbi:response regulator [Pseudomonas fluorescens]|uniref:response regulator n=1 Tax=Pseudomonas fluorescens TaxID=294 RepID=UPI001241AF62|nr:response regulator [Pseudomonas fluorescens]